MLILIAGITGMVGLPCAHAALSRGHTVRGLGRNPNKLPDDLSRRLESFVQSASIYDIPALDRAVKGVDAIICAYTYAPEVVVEGQLLLLRAAERAGVKVWLKCQNLARELTIGPRSSTLPPGTTTGRKELWGSMKRMIRIFRLRIMCV